MGKVIICKRCGTGSDRFHFICPECGRPFVRDYIDARMHPRDPDLQGTFSYKRFWARVFLVTAILYLVFMLCMELYG